GTKRAARKERELASEPAAKAPLGAESARLTLLPDSEIGAASQHAEPAFRSRRLGTLTVDEPVLARRSAAAPLSSYAESAPRRSIAAGPVIGLLVALFLAGGGYIISRNGGSRIWERVGTATRAGYDSAIAA